MGRDGIQSNVGSESVRSVHAPSVNIANIWMPSEAERAERRAMHDRLDAIARELAEARTEAE